MNKKDFYEVLGLKKGATPAEIKKAYRQKAKEYHPDKGGDNEELFKEVAEAYEVLGDADKKAKYDKFGHGGQRQHPFGGYADDVWGTHVPQKRYGEDIRLVIKLTLEEIYTGVIKKYSYNRSVSCEPCHGHGGIDLESCPVCGGSGVEHIVLNTPIGFMRQSMTCATCSGSGETYTIQCEVCKGHGISTVNETVEVEIPAGVQEGMVFMMEGKGQAIKGGDAGSLQVRIIELPHERFLRSGNDLRLTVKLNYPQMVLGTKVEIECIDGGRIRVNIPENSDVGGNLKIQRKGLKHFNNEEYGDILLSLAIDIPKKVDEETKTLLLKLKEKLEENVGAVEK